MSPKNVAMVWAMGLMYLQQIAPKTLDVMVGQVIFKMQEILPSRVIILEGQDRQVWKDHVQTCALCHLENINGHVNMSLMMIPWDLRCMLCGHANGASMMNLCNKCSKGWAHGVFNTSFQKAPNGYWICSKHLHWKNLKLTYLCVIQMIDHIHGMPRNGPWLEMMKCNMTINDGPTSALAHLVHNILVNWKTSLKISKFMASQFEY